ncbi:MAG TPA: hypothetical protein VN873_00565 [Candidatus Angelobacter sp.]|nr:hypothetical protein [Candidatus Angelobacter sp.]
MKHSKIMLAILSGLCALAVQGFGQTTYQINIKGTCLSTNDNGDIVSTKLNNKTYIQDAITATGNTNKNLSLVYVQNGSSDPAVSGDFLEVVDSSGTPIYTNLLFMYSITFPPALTNAAGNQIVIGAQVIPLPLAGSGQSLGGATINERILTKKTIISGSFNYTSLRSPTNSFNDIVNICSGSFNINKPFAPR